MRTFARPGSDSRESGHRSMSPCLRSGGRGTLSVRFKVVSRFHPANSHSFFSVVRSTFASSAAAEKREADVKELSASDFDAVFASIWSTYEGGASWEAYPETATVIEVCIKLICAMQMCKCDLKSHSRTRHHMLALIF